MAGDDPKRVGPHIIDSQEELVALAVLSGRGLIAIDGYHGVGKSSMARDAAAQLQADVLHLDEFLVPHTGRFVEAIRYDDLRRALDRRPLLVEGVCVLAVLKRLAISPDLHVYVRPTRRASIKGGSEGLLYQEVLSYHRRYEPERAADVVFLMGASDEDQSVTERGGRDVDVAFIAASARLAMTLAIGGIITLLAGFGVLLYGVTGDDQAFIRVLGVEVSATGLGGVIVAVSAVWAFLAFQARPRFSRVQRSTEERDSRTGAMRRQEFESTTQIIVEPREPTEGDGSRRVSGEGTSTDP